MVVGSTKSSPQRLGYQCSNHRIHHLGAEVLKPLLTTPCSRVKAVPGKPNNRSRLFKLCPAICSFPDAGITIASFWSGANMCTVVNRGLCFFSRLVKHCSPTIIRSQNVVKKAVFRQQSQTCGNQRIASREQPLVLVRNDSDVQSAGISDCQGCSC